MRGDHVRLQATGDTAAIVGRVIRINTYEVVIAPDDSTLPTHAIAQAQAQRVEVERDARLRAISTEVGAIVGGAAGGAFYYFGLCRTDANGCANEQRLANQAAYYDQAYYSVGSLLVVGGLLVGGVVGHVIAPAPHWDVVAWTTPMRSVNDNPKRALRLAISHRFFAR